MSVLDSRAFSYGKLLQYKFLGSKENPLTWIC